MQKTYLYTRTPRMIEIGGPFDQLPEDLKQRFAAAFYDGLADACMGAGTHAAICTAEHTILQLERVLAFVSDDDAIQVIRDVMAELRSTQ